MSEEQQLQNTVHSHSPQAVHLVQHDELLAQPLLVLSPKINGSVTTITILCVCVCVCQ